MVFVYVCECACTFYSTCINSLKKFIVLVNAGVCGVRAYACAPHTIHHNFFFHSILCSVQCMQYMYRREHVHSAKVGHTHTHTHMHRVCVCVQLPMAICFGQRQNHHYSRKYLRARALTSFERSNRNKMNRFFFSLSFLLRKEIELRNQVSIIH